MTHWFTKKRRVNTKIKKHQALSLGKLPLHIDIQLSGDAPKFEVNFRTFISRLAIVRFRKAYAAIAVFRRVIHLVISGRCNK